MRLGLQKGKGFLTTPLEQGSLFKTAIRRSLMERYALGFMTESPV